MRNRLLESGVRDVRRIPYERARRSAQLAPPRLSRAIMSATSPASSTWTRSATRDWSFGVDPLGGAGVRYWGEIADRYGLESERSSNDRVDPTFGFMTADWDGKIRMDCSSPYAMARLIGLRDRFDLAFGNDTDADRHGIVTRGAA